MQGACLLFFTEGFAGFCEEEEHTIVNKEGTRRKLLCYAMLLQRAAL